MIVKKINGMYLPVPDRFLLRITVENEKKIGMDLFKLTLTRRVVKSMLQAFKKLLIEGGRAPSTKKMRPQKVGQKPLEIAQVFGPHLVTDFNLRKNPRNSSSFLLSLSLDVDKKFQMNCSKKTIEFLFNLFMKLQEKASWNLEVPLKTKKTAGSTKGLNPVKRTLH